MTSNQLTYWRDVETARSNKAKERETERSNTAKEAETQRHNVTEEQIKTVANGLEARGLDIKDKQLLSELTRMFVDVGASGMNQLPDDWLDKMSEEYGVDVAGNASSNAEGFREAVNGFWHEIKDIFKGGGARIIASLF